MSAILIVPLRNDIPNYKFTATLSNVIYTLNINYNGRMQRYLMDINDAQGNQILSGIPLLIARNLTGQYRYLSVPVGNFIVTDETNTDTQPSQYSFGLTNTLYYIDPTQ